MKKFSTIVCSTIIACNIYAQPIVTIPPLLVGPICFHDPDYNDITHNMFVDIQKHFDGWTCGGQSIECMDKVIQAYQSLVEFYYHEYRNAVCICWKNYPLSDETTLRKDCIADANIIFLENIVALQDAVLVAMQGCCEQVNP